MKTSSIVRAVAISAVATTSTTHASADPIPLEKKQPSVTLDSVVYQASAPSPTPVSVDGRRVRSPGQAGLLANLSALTGGGAKGMTLPLAHVDGGPHGFKVEVWGVLATTLQCDGRNLAVKLTWNGAETFRAKITKAGTTRILENQRGSLTLPDFDTTHAGKEELLTVRVVLGEERPDTYSLVVEHEDQRLVFTPNDVTHRAPFQTVRIAGDRLDGFAIADPRFVGGAPATVAPPAAAKRGAPPL